MSHKVSIIIPSYNQEQYLPESIISAITQTYPCEVIVIDDGSNDNSLKIARDFPVKVISQVNKGLASARNTGIMNATGDFIMPLDADDFLSMNCIEKLVEKQKETDADIVAPSLKTFGDSYETIILMENPTLADFKEGNRIGYFSMIRKSALLEVGGYSPKMTLGYEDYHLWINLLTKGKKLVTVPEPLVNYRTKKESMWKSALKHHYELMNQIYKDFPDFIL